MRIGKEAYEIFVSSCLHSHEKDQRREVFIIIVFEGTNLRIIEILYSTKVAYNKIF